MYHSVAYICDQMFTLPVLKTTYAILNILLHSIMVSVVVKSMGQVRNAKIISAKMNGQLVIWLNYACNPQILFPSKSKF